MLTQDEEEVLAFFKKMTQPCNPFQAESLSKFPKEKLDIILNRLYEKGLIRQNMHPQGGVSYEIIS